MRYQHVGLSNGHCLGTITIFQLDLCDLFCACAVGILLYCKYYWAKLAQTCCLGPLTMFRILSLRQIHAMHALTSIVITYMDEVFGQYSFFDSQPCDKLPHHAISCKNRNTPICGPGSTAYWTFKLYMNYVRFTVLSFLVFHPLFFCFIINLVRIL